MPTTRTLFSSAVANGKIYAIGGLDSAWATLKTVEVYDPVSNAWTTGPALRSSRGLHASVTVNGTIYVIGGESALFHPLGLNEALTP
jgi:N-acetylneuraminic acid mutarotase